MVGGVYFTLQTFLVPFGTVVPVSDELSITGGDTIGSEAEVEAGVVDVPVGVGPMAEVVGPEFEDEVSFPEVPPPEHRLDASSVE